jgi:hypothetical protein
MAMCMGTKTTIPVNNTCQNDAGSTARAIDFQLTPVAGKTCSAVGTTDAPTKSQLSDVVVLCCLP